MAKNNAAALPAWRRFLIWNAYRFILIYTRPWSRKMHFFIRFRGRSGRKKQRSLRANILDFLKKKCFFLAKKLHISNFCCNFAADLVKYHFRLVEPGP